MAVRKRDVVRLPHHERDELCTTRAKYRQGRKFTAVKVYTVNNESQHILVCGVPSLGLQDDLRKLCSRFGDVKSLVYIPNYAQEEFTDAYHVQYTRIQSARFAKRHMDGRSFFGGILHVCYGPEMESVEETRAKLIQRRKDVANRIREDNSDQSKLTSGNDVAPRQYHRRKKHPALPLTAERLSAETECIWQGIPQDIDPRRIAPAAKLMQMSVYGPLKPDDKWFQAGVRERRLIPNSTIVSTSTIAPSTSQCSTVYSSANVSQALRFIPRQVNINKRIVFRNNSSSQSSVSEVRSKTEDGSSETISIKRKSPLDSTELSMEETILNVRKKIRAVTVPNVQIVLEGKNNQH